MTTLVLTPSGSGKSRAGRFTAVDRLMAIAPMLEHNRLYARRYKMRPPLTQIASQVAAEQGVCSSTIWRWYRKFKKGGYAALAHTRRDRGRSRYMDQHPEVERMVRGRVAAGRSAFFVWRTLGTSLGPDEMPSYTTVRMHLKRQKALGRRAVTP